MFNIINKINKSVSIFKIISIILVIAILFSLTLQVNNLKVGIRKFMNGLGIYTEEVSNVSITSHDYNNPGSLKVKKSAKWLSKDEVELVIETNSIAKTNAKHRDIILVLDTSVSMSGPKIDKMLENVREFVEYTLSDTNNRMALVIFDTYASVWQYFTNSMDDMFYSLDYVGFGYGSNYHAALKNVDKVLDNYQKEEDRDVSVIFISDGNPTVEVNNTQATYEMLKEKHPYLTVYGIHYDYGFGVGDEIKAISDYHYPANTENIGNVLYQTGIAPEHYEEFTLTNYINEEYFTVDSIDKIRVTNGSAKLTEEDGVQKITWDFSDSSYMTGAKEKMNIILTLKDNLLDEERYFPITTKDEIGFKLLDNEKEVIDTNETPVLKNQFDVIYDVNTPSECNIDDIPKEEYIIYEDVAKLTSELSCDGYIFKGWEFAEEDEKDIIKVNDDLFKMPTHDVKIRGVWSKVGISKSMRGQLNEVTSLYNVIKNEAREGKYVKEYTGPHQDSMDPSKSTKKIYHFYAEDSKTGNEITNRDNVLFADKCWKIIRTTDTGGVRLLYDGEAENNRCLGSRSIGIGYRYAEEIYLADNYYYGTDYTYDKSAKKFKLAGTIERATWGNATWRNLVGKFTCRSTSEDGTCSSIYQVLDYVSSEFAESIYVTYNMAHSNVGLVNFDYVDESIGAVGYQHGDLFENKHSYSGYDRSFITDQKVLDARSIVGDDPWFSDSVNYSSGRYSLKDPYRLSTISDYSELVGKYTILHYSSSYTASYVYYIIGYEDGYVYYETLKSGNTLPSSSFDSFLFGDSMTKNDDGSYTINNPVYIRSASDWLKNYKNAEYKYFCEGNSNICYFPRFTTLTSGSRYYYAEANYPITLAKGRDGLNLTDYVTITYDELLKNYANYSDYKFTCGGFETTCEDHTLLYITEYNEKGFNYYKNHYFGSDVQWTGSYFTLVDPIGIENIDNPDMLATHHYSCLDNNNTTCGRVGYIFSDGGDSNLYYYEFSKGTNSLQDAFDEMFKNNETDSLIKTVVENWYAKYMTPYDKYIEDTIYCNDRSIYEANAFNPNGGRLDSMLKFNGFTSSTDLSCPNVTDRFSISNPQATLKYKVGLITAPEMHLVNNNSARKCAQKFWLGSPAAYLDGTYRGASVGIVKEDGSISHEHLSLISGVRPAITLAPDVICSGGNGSGLTPYTLLLE